MTTNLHIQIPCTFESNLFRINSLNLECIADTAELGLLESIKNSPYFTSLKDASVINFKDHRGRDFIFLEVPFTNLVYDSIIEIEPMPNTSSKKQLKSFLLEPSAEEIIKLGY